MRSRGRARGALPALLGREWFRRDALVRARLEPKGSLRKNSGSHIHASHARQALVNGERFVCYVGFGFQSPPALLRRHRACRAARRAREGQVGAQGLRKNSGSHIDASHSRQPLVKGERLVRHEVNAVMEDCCNMAIPNATFNMLNIGFVTLQLLWASHYPCAS